MAGSIQVNAGGVLAAAGPSGYTSALQWLQSGVIATSSSGCLALTANENSTLSLGTSGYNSLFLGALGSNTFSGTLTPGTGGYLLGGGGGTLTAATALSGTNSATINGNVLLAGSNSYTGGTTINKGGLLRFGPTATVPASGTVQINAGGVLAATGPAGYTSALQWLSSGAVATSSSGCLALTANENSTLSLGTSGYNSLFLGSIGSTTFSGTLTPGTGGYLLGGGGGTLTVATALSGTNSATINGNVLLAGANSYSGGTTINNGGLLQFGPAATLPASGTFQINAGGVLAVPGGTTAALWLGSGSVATSSSGCLALTASENSELNLAALGYNSLFLGSIGSNTFSGTLMPGNNGYLLGGGGGSLTIAANLAASTSATIDGSVVLAGSNSYTGGTTINAGGLLQFGPAASFPTSGTIQINSGGVLAVPKGLTAAQCLQSGLIAASSYGCLALAASDNSALVFSASYNGLYLGSIGNNTFSGTLAPGGNGYLLGGGGGLLTVATNLASGTAAATINGNVVLAGSNSYTGATALNSGTLLLANSAALLNSTLNFGGPGAPGLGSLAFSGGIGTFLLGGLAGGNPPSALALTDAAGAAVTLNVGGNNASTVFSGAIGGSGSLVKSGTGDLDLLAANSYSGTTSIVAGRLIVGPGGSLGGGAVSVASGGELYLSARPSTTPSISRAAAPTPAARCVWTTAPRSAAAVRWSSRGTPRSGPIAGSAPSMRRSAGAAI